VYDFPVMSSGYSYMEEYAKLSQDVPEPVDQEMAEYLAGFPLPDYGQWPQTTTEHPSSEQAPSGQSSADQSGTGPSSAEEPDMPPRHDAASTTESAGRSVLDRLAITRGSGGRRRARDSYDAEQSADYIQYQDEPDYGGTGDEILAAAEEASARASIPHVPEPEDVPAPPDSPEVPVPPNPDADPKPGRRRRPTEDPEHPVPEDPSQPAPDQGAGAAGPDHPGHARQSGLAALAAEPGRRAPGAEPDLRPSEEHRTFSAETGRRRASAERGHHTRPEERDNSGSSGELARRTVSAAGPQSSQEPDRHTPDAEPGRDTPAGEPARRTPPAQPDIAPQPGRLLPPDLPPSPRRRRFPTDPKSEPGRHGFPVDPEPDPLSPVDPEPDRRGVPAHPDIDPVPDPLFPRDPAPQPGRRGLPAHPDIDPRPDPSFPVEPGQVPGRRRFPADPDQEPEPDRRVLPAHPDIDPPSSRSVPAAEARPAVSISDSQESSGGIGAEPERRGFPYEQEDSRRLPGRRRRPEVKATPEVPESGEQEQVPAEPQAGGRRRKPEDVTDGHRAVPEPADMRSGSFAVPQRGGRRRAPEQPGDTDDAKTSEPRPSAEASEQPRAEVESEESILRALAELTELRARRQPEPAAQPATEEPAARWDSGPTSIRPRPDLTTEKQQPGPSRWDNGPTVVRPLPRLEAENLRERPEEPAPGQAADERRTPPPAESPEAEPRPPVETAEPPKPEPPKRRLSAVLDGAERPAGTPNGAEDSPQSVGRASRLRRRERTDLKLADLLAEALVAYQSSTAEGSDEDILSAYDDTTGRVAGDQQRGERETGY
jgi:hypothetical protein